MSIDRDGEGPPLRREDAKPSASHPDDLRATAFTDDVFDDDYYGRRRRGGPFGLIAGVVFGAAVAAAAGWYLLGSREGATVADGADKNGVVHADANPYKVKPEEPGGLQVENQDKLVYERLDKSAKPTDRVENLLPEPEQPKAPPVKKADVPPTAAAAPVAAAPAQPAQPTATASDDPLAKLVAKVEGVKTPPPADKAAEPVASAPAAPAPAKPLTPASPSGPPAATPANVPAATAANAPLQLGPKPSADDVVRPPAPAVPAPPVPPAAAPAAPAPSPLIASAPQAVAPTAPQPVPAPAQVAPGMVTPATTPGAMFLQLASARSEDAAMGEWKRITAKNGDLLGSLSPSVVQADLGDKGTYYRLRAGPVADKATAEGLCTSLASRNVGCIVVKP